MNSKFSSLIKEAVKMTVITKRDNSKLGLELTKNKWEKHGDKTQGREN